MPKKRKTRKDKILLDQKKQVVHEIAPPLVLSSQKESHPTEPETVTSGMTFSLPAVPETTHATPAKMKQSPATIAVSTSEYGYLSNDLVRTALLTGAIVFAELLIRIFFVH